MIVKRSKSIEMSAKLCGKTGNGHILFHVLKKNEWLDSVTFNASRTTSRRMISLFCLCQKECARSVTDNRLRSDSDAEMNERRGPLLHMMR